jgi:predicted ribosomally synthesized peptide with nif11-like leader
VTANSDETLKKQLEAATSPESLVKIAARQGYELTVTDIETLRRRTEQQAQLNSDEEDDELSEQELELVAGGFGGFITVLAKSPVPQWIHVPNKPKPKPPWW